VKFNFLFYKDSDRLPIAPNGPAIWRACPASAGADPPAGGDEPNEVSSAKLTNEARKSRSAGPNPALAEQKPLTIPPLRDIRAGVPLF